MLCSLIKRIDSHYLLDMDCAHQDILIAIEEANKEVLKAILIGRHPAYQLIECIAPLSRSHRLVKSHAMREGKPTILE